MCNCPLKAILRLWIHALLFVLNQNNYFSFLTNDQKGQTYGPNAVLQYHMFFYKKEKCSFLAVEYAYISLRKMYYYDYIRIIIHCFLFINKVSLMHYFICKEYFLVLFCLLVLLPGKPANLAL